MDESRVRCQPAGFDSRPSLHFTPAKAGIIHQEDTMARFEDIKIIPPLPGACKICATVHGPAHPHDKNSLYYMNWFWKRYKRFPTWEDAMSYGTDKALKKGGDDG